MKKRAMEEAWASTGSEVTKRDLLPTNSVQSLTLEVPTGQPSHSAITSSDTGSSGPTSRKETANFANIAKSTSLSKSSQSPGSNSSLSPHVVLPQQQPTVMISPSPSLPPHRPMLESSDSTMAIRYVTKSTRRRADDQSAQPTNTLQAMLVMQRRTEEREPSPRQTGTGVGTASATPSFADMERPSTSISKGGTH
jgi:hypothetical protein